MATKHIASMQVALEGSFGSVSPTTGAPDVSALTFYAAEVADIGQIQQAGDAVMTPRDTMARSGPYATPADPGTVKDQGGTWLKKSAGTLSVTMPVRGIGEGTAYATPATMPLWMLLATMFDVYEVAAPAADAVAVVGTVNTHTGTGVAANLGAIGTIFKSLKNGRVDFSALTNLVGQAATYSPALVTAATLAQALRPMRTAYVRGRGVPATTASVALKLSGIGWQQTLVGVRATKMSLGYTEESGRLDVTFDLMFEYATTAVLADGTVPIKYADGGVLHHMMSFLKISASGGTKAIPIAAPAALAADSPCLDGFELSVEVVRSRVGCGETAVGAADLEAVNVLVTGSVTLGGVSASYTDDLWDGRQRSIMIGFASGDHNVGECGCIYIPSAVLAMDPDKRDTAKDHQRTKLQIAGAGYWGGDNAAVGTIDNSIFRLALGSLS